MQRTRRALGALIVLATLTLTACGPTPTPAPPPAATVAVAGTCYGTPVEAEVAFYFGATPAYDRLMRVILPRESGCDPCAFYPSTHDCAAHWPATAKGLFQLTSIHDAQVRAACPFIPEAWRYAHCATKAARWLYDSNGLAPWGG